jgi:hypothetical protein
LGDRLARLRFEMRTIIPQRTREDDHEHLEVK